MNWALKTMEAKRKENDIFKMLKEKKNKTISLEFISSNNIVKKQR